MPVGAEKRYHFSQLDYLALKLAICDHFKPYLYYAKVCDHFEPYLYYAQHCDVFNDNNSLLMQFQLESYMKLVNLEQVSYAVTPSSFITNMATRIKL